MAVAFLNQLADHALMVAKLVVPGAAPAIAVAENLIGLIDKAKEIVGDTTPALDSARTKLELAVNEHVDRTVDTLRGG